MSRNGTPLGIEVDDRAPESVSGETTARVPKSNGVHRAARMIQDWKVLAMAAFGLMALGYAASRWIVPAKDYSGTVQDVEQLKVTQAANTQHLTDHDAEFKDIHKELDDIRADVKDIRGVVDPRR